MVKKQATEKSPKTTGKKSSSTSTGSEPAVKALGPFDFINSVLKTKTNLIRSSDNEELTEKSYNAFLTNKALSFHVDTVLYANEMNRRGHLDSRMQYEYYLSNIRPMNRGHFWPKKAAAPDIELVQQRYKVNVTRAEEIISIVGKHGLEQIRKSMTTGGAIR